MNGEKTVKESLEGKPGREREKKESRMRRMEGVELDMRLVDVKMQHKCFRENKTRICREGK
jgi:hypothetical protein